jgi:hypothetical protein
MSQRMTDSAVVGVIGLLMLWPTAGVAPGAEFRTSARGKTIVRQATYQTPDATALPNAAGVPDAIPPATIDLSESVIDPMLADPQADAVDCDWTGQGEPGYFGPCSGWTYWGSVEFLLWWRKSQEFPPLVTTSPVGTSTNVAGLLGAPDTQVLYPTESQGSDARPGARLTLGVWFDPCEFSGFGARLYTLGETTSSYDVDSDSFQILARPFYNLTAHKEDVDLVADPGFTTGGISVSNGSRVGGGDMFIRRLLFRDDCRRIDLLAGYQFAKIDSDVLVASSRTSIRRVGSIPYGTVINMYDSFDTTNRFHAGEIGLLGEYDRGDITWSLLAKVGLGSMKQRTEIVGHTNTRIPGEQATTSEQGLLALGTNIGVYEQNLFTVSPEIQLTAAYHLNDCVDLTCGYSFIYWNHAAQPGLQIDRVINTTQITGALVGDPRPAFPNQDSDFFVHGLNIGVQFIW